MNKKKGILNFIINKKNIFVTISDLYYNKSKKISLGIFCNRASERKQESTSSRLLKNIVRYLKKKESIVFSYYIKGDAPLQDRTTLLNNFCNLAKRTKIEIVFIQLPKAYNGCRPPKIRRV